MKIILDGTLKNHNPNWHPKVPFLLHPQKQLPHTYTKAKAIVQNVLNLFLSTTKDSKHTSLRSV
jgi:hypothetical protein